MINIDVYCWIISAVLIHFFSRQILNFRFIRCWDAKTSHEIYRITVGLGGLGSGPELCIWSLLALRFNMNSSCKSLYYKLRL